MVKKIINWLTKTITGDETISRIIMTVIAVIMISFSLYFVFKDTGNLASIQIGEDSEQLLPSEL